MMKQKPLDLLTSKHTGCGHDLHLRPNHRSTDRLLLWSLFILSLRSEAGVDGEMIPLPETCVGCPLYSPRKGFSVLEGDGSSGLMVIAESLGRMEERDSLPLRPNAPSGGVFQKAVDTSGLSRKVMTLTNTIRCKAEAPYPPEALAHCRQYLDAAIEERKPKFILALGDVPLQQLSATPVIQSEVRGYVLPTRYGVPMIATFHPSRIARGDWQIYGVLQHDLRRANAYAASGVPAPLRTNYCLNPTRDDLYTYLDRLHNDPTLPVAYDIETEELIVKHPRQPKRIIQMQFSSAVGEAIVLGERWFDYAAAILALPNPKWDYNGRLFDRPLLRKAGFELNGEFHDLMEVYAHCQSGFVSNKDATTGDKGVPAKLMSLQSCLSFYYPNVRPWKGVQFPEWNSRWDDQLLPLPVRLYGARDVDYTTRVGHRLLPSIERNGLSVGYRQHKFLLGTTVLDGMSARGLPVDREKQTELREYINGQETELLTELQVQVPVEVKAVKPYKSLPKDLRAALKEVGCKPKKAIKSYFCEQAVAIAESMGFDFHYADDGSYEYRLRRILPFNPNSSPQLITYIKHRGYPVPLHIDSKRPTTGKDAIDALIEDTDDDVLKMGRQMRQLTKIRGTYTEGHWVPGRDGRVHPEFTFGTASGQLAARYPNSMQYPQHGALAKMAKACIRAEEGHTFIKRDMRSFHARTLAWLSGDLAYWTLSDEDVHSFVAANFLKLPVASRLLQMTPQDRRAELCRIKREHADVRNLQAKRAILGLGFHMGVDKLYRMNPDSFASPLEAQALVELIQSLFPQAFVEYPKSIQKRIKANPRLVSPTGHQRWVWSGDLEQAVSFEPANIAHCHMFDSMLIMQERGLLDRWQLVNMIHDCLIFHCPNELIDECIEGSREIMERQSTVLVDSPLGIPFQCSSDVEIGVTMAEMEAV